MTTLPRAAVHRVAMVLPRLDLGGMERTVLAQAAALREHAVDVHLVVLRTGGDLMGEAERLGIPMHDGGTLARAHDAETFLVALGRRLQMTHLHSHTGTWWPAARAARRLAIPHLHTRHGFVEHATWRTTVTEWLAARQTDVVICVSEALRMHTQRTLHVPRRRCVLLRNGIVDDTWMEESDAVPIDPAPTLGMVCRLSPVKNVPLTVRTLASLGASWPSLTLHLVGDGPDRQTIAACARDAGVDGLVHLHGASPTPWTFIPPHAIIVQSSDSEGLSLSLIEAMARGHRIVATDVGETRAFCGSAPGVRIVPAGDGRAMAAALDELLSWTPPAIRSAAVAHQAHARANGSLTAVIDAMLALYARTHRID